MADALHGSREPPISPLALLGEASGPVHPPVNAIDPGSGRKAPDPRPCLRRRCCSRSDPRLIPDGLFLRPHRSAD
jgi:hypothetical protein